MAFSNIKVWKHILFWNPKECPPCWQQKQLREKGEDQDTSYRAQAAIWEVNIWQAQSGCPQDTDPSFNCSHKVEKVFSCVEGPGARLLWDTPHSAHVKWNCPTPPGFPQIRKVLSFREEFKEKLKFSMKFPYVHVSKSKFLLHRYSRKFLETGTTLPEFKS